MHTCDKNFTQFQSENKSQTKIDARGLNLNSYESNSNVNTYKKRRVYVEILVVYIYIEGKVESVCFGIIYSTSICGPIH